LFLSFSVHAQTEPPLHDERGKPFSYFATAVDQLGIKSCPEAMAVTNGGTFSNAFVGIEFLHGPSLNTTSSRIINLKEGYLPVISFSVSEGNISYDLEAFSTTQNLDPSENLFTLIRWKVVNNGPVNEKAELGFRLHPLYGTGWKEFLRHNRYCTPWYRDQFMDIDRYESKQELVLLENGSVFQGDHMILNLPSGFKPVMVREGDNPAWSEKFELKPGETRELIFSMPVVPVSFSLVSPASTFKDPDVSRMKEEIVDYWKSELEDITVISVPEEKVMNMFRTSYFNLLTANDLLADKANTIQRCNEFQYDHFYVRDNAYFARVYDMLGMHDLSLNILRPYIIYDIEGKPLHFRQRTGVYNKLCHDYWGQVLWALGSHYRQTRDTAFLEYVYQLLPNHLHEFKLAVEKDPRGLWPASWPYDNEHIDGHYTGHNFWAVLGLRYAILMADAMGESQKAAEWQETYDDFINNLLHELENITSQTGGYIPPGMDDPRDGYDWANASAGLYPFEALDKMNPMVKNTLETVRNYNFMEGISTYSGCNALLAKEYSLENKELPERGLHHYETFYVTNGNLVIGEQKKVIEDLYSILVHTSSTNAGFEWRPSPWGNRDPGFNRPPHGWCAARYIELIRNMMVREEGNDIHLLSAISPYWIREGEEILVKDAPTYFGDVGLHLEVTGNKSFEITLDAEWNDELNNIYLHIPWFLGPAAASVDGENVQIVDNSIQLNRDSRKIMVRWDKKIEQELNYQEAVNIYLHKYHNRPPDADYVHLFPTLAAPKYTVDVQTNRLKIFSPDNYAEVYYSLDGSVPGLQSHKYKKPLELAKYHTIKAVCIDADEKISDCITISANELSLILDNNKSDE
jgi:hypothetical protein